MVPLRQLLEHLVPEGRGALPADVKRGREVENRAKEVMCICAVSIFLNAACTADVRQPPTPVLEVWSHLQVCVQYLLLGTCLGVV